MARPKIFYLGCLSVILLAFLVEAAYDTGSSPVSVSPPSDSGSPPASDSPPSDSEAPTKYELPPSSSSDDKKGGKDDKNGETNRGDDKGGKKEDNENKDGKKGGDDKGGKKEDNENKGGNKKGGDDKGGKKEDKDGKKGDDKNDDKKGGKKGDEDQSRSPPYAPPTPSPSSSSPTPSPPSPSTPPPSSPYPSPPTPSTPPSPTPPSPTPTSPPTPPPQTPTPSSTPSAPSPPPSGVASRKRVRCKNKYYGQCYSQEHVCPASCPTSCQVDCVTCKPVCNCDQPGAVCQDPRFVGGDGITFYFHGKKNKDFCLVSDPNLHINAHFIGKRNANMGRDFTWVQSIGLLFDNHQLFLGARDTSTWDDAKDRLSLTFDGEPIFLDEIYGSKWVSTTTPLVTITRTSDTNNVVVEVQGKLKITTKVVPISEEESRVHNYGITKEDCFAHLDLGFKFHSLTTRVDGVLGKTYRDDYVSQVKMGVANPIIGGDSLYATSSIFATDCLASRFAGVKKETSLDTLDLASINCGSGMNGLGVVCKR